jgi:predicted metal-dependent hydrolase
MEQIFISNIKIDVVRKDIKNIHLAVYPPTGRVRIAVPLLVNEEAVRLFAISKLGWIKRQQRNFEGQERTSPREYKNRESHYFQGRRYLLNVIEANAPAKVVLKSKTYINLYIRPGTSTAKRHEIMNEWYRKELKKMIPELIGKWEKQINLKVNEWQVKLMKTKWGSCNIKKKRIWVNLELAKKPIHCLEYIIVHEMLHLLERHHNEKFLHYMDTYLPNWKKLRAELNKLPVSHADWSY